MFDYVYVYTEFSAANDFAKLLIENGYTDSTTYARDVRILCVFYIHVKRKDFARFTSTAADCITTEDFIDLFL